MRLETEADSQRERKCIRLSEACEFLRGVSFDPSEVSPYPRPGYLPILRAGNIANHLDLDNDLIWVHADRVAPEQLLRVGDIAICMSSGSPAVVGKTAQLRTQFAGSVGAFCGIIRSRPSHSADYLALWLRSSVFLAWRDTQARGANIQNLRFSQFADLAFPSEKLEDQRRIAAEIRGKLDNIEKARAAATAQLEAAKALPAAYLRALPPVVKVRLGDALEEVGFGVGASWSRYRVLGATRLGLAQAKESVGKSPERYKLVQPGTIFYNPMRIMIGSIAMVDYGEEPGITSPDYVVFRTRQGVLHPRWFYYWLRSTYGQELIRSLARGAVRERLLFNRLSNGFISLPSWEDQGVIAEKLLAVRRVEGVVADSMDVAQACPAAYLRQVFTEGNGGL